MSQEISSRETSADEHAEPVDAGAVEIHRNGVLAVGIGVVAGLVCLAYLSRAIGGGTWVDWTVTLVMGALAAAYLAIYADARTPILVADSQGIRLRLGRTWRGVPWESIECVEHQPRRGLLGDGRLVLVAEHPETLLADLDRSGRRQVAVTRRLHGSPFAVPLSISTVVSGAEGDLTVALTALADDPAQVVELVEQYDESYDQLTDEPYDQLTDGPDDRLDDELPAHPVLHDPRPTLARGLDFLADRLRLHRDVPEDVPQDLPDRRETTLPTMPLVASATPLPLRDPVGGSRVEVRFEGAAALKTDPADDEHATRHELPETGALRRGSDLDDVEQTVVWGDRVSPIARPGQPVDALVIDDVDVEPAAEPVIGPELAAARTRLGLTVDELAERTRIRPHVIESIEVDDFAPCGGDFYARGHLRTLARVLGAESAPLLESYDERYADAPIDARRVFEAELATAAEGPIRSTRGGPNWSVLIAAVMALVLAWSIARLIMDSPVELHDKPVLLTGSPSARGALPPPVPVLLDASTGGAHVVVRDGAGEVVFNGNLSYGQQKQLKAAPPVRVQSSDGALQVTVDGQARGPLGAAGQPAQNTFAAAR